MTRYTNPQEYCFTQVQSMYTIYTHFVILPLILNNYARLQFKMTFLNFKAGDLLVMTPDNSKFCYTEKDSVVHFSIANMY